VPVIPARWWGGVEGSGEGALPPSPAKKNLYNGSVVVIALFPAVTVSHLNAHP